MVEGVVETSALLGHSPTQAGYKRLYFCVLASLARAFDPSGGHQPLPTRTESETRQRELFLIVGFIVLLFGLSAGLSLALKALDFYPGPYAVAYLAAWVPLAVAWNLLGYSAPLKRGTR